MTHEYMKNIDPKMVEAILNEVIQVATTDWNDIAGLDGVKRTIQVSGVNFNIFICILNIVTF